MYILHKNKRILVRTWQWDTWDTYRACGEGENEQPLLGDRTKPELHFPNPGPMNQNLQKHLKIIATGTIPLHLGRVGGSNIL